MNYIKTTLLLIPLIFIFGCSSGSGKYKNVNTKKASKLIKENKELTILDVRSSEEYNEAHIPNSINIDIMQTSFVDKVSTLGKTNSYLVYCRSGNRSTQASEAMAKLGFSNVNNLQSGGYAELIMEIESK